MAKGIDKINIHDMHKNMREHSNKKINTQDINVLAAHIKSQVILTGRQDSDTVIQLSHTPGQFGEELEEVLYSCC